MILSKLSKNISSTCYLLHHFRFFYTSSIPTQHQSPPHELYQYNKRIQELGSQGYVDQSRDLFNEAPHRDIGTWNSMINAYSKSGQIDEARTLFDSCAAKNVRTWTSIVTCYAKNGRIAEARELFDEMPERNVVSWNAMISGYVQNRDLVSARRLFDEMPEREVASWNSLLTGYSHAGRMDEARELFDEMGDRNLVSWMVMISGYVYIIEFLKGWELFVNMHCNGMLPDQSIFVVTLSAVTGLSDSNLIEMLRSLAVKMSYEGDVVVGTGILNTYTRTGCLSSAYKFYESMPVRNEYTWTTMLAAFSKSGRLQDAIAIYESAPEHGVALQTAMLTAYTQNGRIHEARRLFDMIPRPNVVTWNAMVVGYAQNELFDEAIDVFQRMPMKNSASWAGIISAFAQKGQSGEALKLLSELHRSGMVPSESCFTSVFSACANIKALEFGRQLHTLSIKTANQFNTYVGNGLISMYAKCRSLGNVSQVFDMMRVKDTVSWNSVISGLAQNYMLDDARSIFERMPKRDVVSWTAMISGYAQAGDGDLALELFFDMLSSGTKPNSSTLTGLLVTCASLGATRLGMQIQNFIIKLGLDHDIFLCNSLITMYFKCGTEDGFLVFSEMYERDIITWNAILIGCAQNGFGVEAVQFFEQMKADGILPNQISILGVLCACSHAGLVDKGRKYFDSMQVDYGIMPSEAHYACMVDLLGRAGHLHEAEALIENMPIEPDSVVWAALLGACRIHRNVDLGRRVAERLFQLDPLKSGNYVLLSNIYASLGMWDEVKEIRKLMKDRGVMKNAGISWIQINNRLLSFANGDKTQDRIEEVYKLLTEYRRRLGEAGYTPDTNFVLHDVEEEQKENSLLYHSEKLAIAYGLLNSPQGTLIQIMKNLRICGDCHSFTKFLSKVTQRKIVIRDGNRFHHFYNGSCSCRDYW